MDYIPLYSACIDDLVRPGADARSSQILTLLEAIDDSTADVNAIFRKEPKLLAEPVHWIDVLRFLRYSIQQKMLLNQFYDIFVSAYTDLGNILNPDEDEEKLKTELGLLMYSIDEATGNHERLAEKILQELAVHMNHALMRHGNTQNMYNSRISSSIQGRINELTQELSQIVHTFRENHAIAVALDRMRVLILGSSEILIPTSKNN
ncbi:MAG: hypothetical protein KDK39_05765 [Leptospiraceae bacterium]|nr:hypothetical protein [Leptospiraceae bacterium]